MRRKIKNLLTIIIVAVVFVSGATAFLVHKMRSTFNNDKVVSELTSEGVKLNTQIIPFGNYSIHTKYIGDRSLPKVLLIHGSPGYWFDFKKIYTDSLLREKFCIISYDRPGYGQTNIPAMEKLQNQARVAAKILNHFTKPNEKSIVLGHSFGGAVLQQVLIDYPEKIEHAIYVAPCLSPQYQEAKWYNILAAGGIPQLIMPHELKNSNTEMITLSKCLADNESKIANIKVPTTYIQGNKDILVPHQTLDYYKKLHQDIKIVQLEDLDHFVPWSNPGLIIDAINDASGFTN